MTTLRTWTGGELDTFATAFSVHLHAGADDDRAGESVEIGVVVVGRSVFVRAYRGSSSRWYQAARSRGTGWLRHGGTTWDVAFSAVPAAEHPDVADGVDDAYRRKYGALAGAATGSGMRAATLRIDPLTS